MKTPNSWPRWIVSFWGQHPDINDCYGNRIDMKVKARTKSEAWRKAQKKARDKGLYFRPRRTFLIPTSIMLGKQPTEKRPTEEKPIRKSGEHLFVPAGGHPICATCGCDEDDAFVGGRKCTYRASDKTERQDLKQKTVYVVCRYWQIAKKEIYEFFRVCSTEDKAQAKVDELTQDYGPTFVILPVPLDPPSPFDS